MGKWYEANDPRTWSIESIVEINKDLRTSVKQHSEPVRRYWICIKIGSFKIWSIKIHDLWHSEWILWYKNGNYIETKTWLIIEIGIEINNKREKVRVWKINRWAKILQRFTKNNDITQNIFTIKAAIWINGANNGKSVRFGKCFENIDRWR